MCLDIELALRNKEEELNLIIVELRKSFASLQEKLAKEESDMLVRGLDSEFNVVCENLFLLGIC